MATLEDLEQYKHLVGYESTSIRTMKDRYDDVNAWGWQDGVLKDRETLEPVSIEGDAPGFDYVVFLPGDVKYLLVAMGILGKAFDDVFEIARQALAEPAADS